MRKMLSRPTRLYIIGNGFDLHYGIKSSYRDFFSYLLETNPLPESLLTEYCQGDLWRDFESGLGLIPESAFFANVFGILQDNDADWDQILTSWDAQALSIEQNFNASQIARYFQEWVNQIDVSPAFDDGLIVDDEHTAFLSFNYTRTLEDRLGIEQNRILHIHGRSGDDDLVFGHAHLNISEPRRLHDFSGQDTLEELRIKFIANTEKPVSRILSGKQGWFEQLSNLQEIIVAGFSFGKVDLPYIKKIVEMAPNARWAEYCYGPQKVSRNPYISTVKLLAYPNSTHDGVRRRTREPESAVNPEASPIYILEEVAGWPARTTTARVGRLDAI